jgi:CBS-domain-containing membrane protein
VVDKPLLCACDPLEISEQDVLTAMKAMQGYIDITPADFRQVYRAAYALARDRMNRSMKAGDVMTSPVHVIHVAMDLVDIAAMLADKEISGAPVVDDAGRILGVVSEKDFLARMGAGPTSSFMRLVAHCLRENGCLVGTFRRQSARDMMSSPAITVQADAPIGEITKLMADRRINRLPVVDGDRRLIGIITRSNLVASYCTLG